MDDGEAYLLGHSESYVLLLISLWVCILLLCVRTLQIVHALFQQLRVIEEYL